MASTAITPSTVVDPRRFDRRYREYIETALRFLGRFGEEALDCHGLFRVKQGLRFAVAIMDPPALFTFRVIEQHLGVDQTPRSFVDPARWFSPVGTVQAVFAKLSIDTSLGRSRLVTLERATELVRQLNPCPFLSVPLLPVRRVWFRLPEKEGDAGVVRGFTVEPRMDTCLHVWNNRQGLHLRFSLRIMQDAIRGLEFLHSVGLVHRDFKLENLLVGYDGRGKLGDGEFIEEEERLTVKSPVIGTPGFIPPEAMSSTGKHTRLGDVWAVGKMLIDLLTFPTDHPECPRAPLAESVRLLGGRLAREVPEERLTLVGAMSALEDMLDDET